MYSNVCLRSLSVLLKLQTVILLSLSQLIKFLRTRKIVVSGKDSDNDCWKTDGGAINTASVLKQKSDGLSALAGHGCIKIILVS